MTGSEDDSDPRSVADAFSIDLAAVTLVVLTGVLTTVLPSLQISFVQTLLAAVYVVFVPGYVLTLVLFPAAATTPASDDSTQTTTSRLDRTKGSDADQRPDLGPDSSVAAISSLRRVALSVGASFGLVALLGTVVTLVMPGQGLSATILVVSLVTALLIPVAFRQRASVPPNRRFHVAIRTWPSTISSTLLRSDSRADLALTAVFVVMLLLAAGSVGYAATVPKEKGNFTEFYLLTTSKTGELVADDYPTEFVAGEPRPIIVGIGNQEHERVSYTVLVELQDVRVENDRVVVLDRERLHQFSPTVAHNSTWLWNHRIEPTMTGTRLRLTYLLYRGTPPSTPTSQNAYREVRLWINVSAPQQATEKLKQPPAPALRA